MNSKLRFLLISLFIFFVAALQASADGDIRVSGVVMSEGEPLPGASVLVKGTHNGTVTDVDGKYTLTVPADGTLVFSFIGLKTTEQKVNGRTVVNAELLPDSEQLDEVMVVAYATAKKYSFTGAASTVKGSEIAKMQVSNVSRALEGTVSGLQASAPSGQPGTDAEIRIRGIGSINASSAPLYVVDGVPFDGSINSINPEDIASLTVLKRCRFGCSLRFAGSQRCHYHNYQAGTYRLENHGQHQCQLRWFQPGYPRLRPCRNQSVLRTLLGSFAQPICSEFG